MMNVHQWRSRLVFAVRCGAFAIALCLAVAPISMSCCSSSFPCSATQPRGNSDVPCHGSPESHPHHSSSAAADFSACHAGEFALEAVRQESKSGKAHESLGYSSSVDSLSNSYMSLLEASNFLTLQTHAISPHLHNQSSPYQPLRI
jgi:hypothetical protein